MSCKLPVARRFSVPGLHPFHQVEWEIRDALIGDPGEPVFEQRGVEFPKSWSQNATNVVAQKCFQGRLESPERESSVKQMIARVAGLIARWGRQGSYFATEADAEAFEMELTAILLHQRASFDSPIWVNLGREEEPRSTSCFHLSNVRGSMELQRKGGTASGPVRFLHSANAWAGTIRPGGKTRPGAKMVVLDLDHPDVEDFAWCKADEERKARVRVSDVFMQAVEEDGQWNLIARSSGETVKTVRARELLEQMAAAAWNCDDPGVQYETTIDRWHTCPKSGRIDPSNACSEYMHLDDSAATLASLNLMKFRRADGSFDTEGFSHAVDVVFLAQEILVGASSYPTEEIGDNARRFRKLGLGYANLGALLMSDGLRYDSPESRNVAAAITALMTGRAYRQSALIAAATTPYEEYGRNREPHNGVMRMHRDAAYAIDPTAIRGDLLSAARRSWDEAVELGEVHGYRNAGATVLAPAGTIGFLMDCDTTGIEPDSSLVRQKELVGGGRMTIVKRSVPLALAALGYSEAEIDQIDAHITENGTIVGAPGLRKEHLPVFDVAVGERAISHTGQIEMMAATQPFLSGAISKTVNMPRSATVADIADAYLRGWKGGLKALAIYRDGSKTARALRGQGGPAGLAAPS